MKYYSRVGQNEYEIEILDGKVLINGEAVEIDLRQSGAPELYSLLYNGRSFELLIEAERFNYGVTLRGERFEVQVEDERTRRLNVGRKVVAVPEGELAINAPIPGLVVKVLVEVGDEVEVGQPICVLEAMKMENNIAADKAGKVTEVKVTPGQAVGAGDVVAVIV